MVANNSHSPARTPRADRGRHVSRRRTGVGSDDAPLRLESALLSAAGVARVRRSGSRSAKALADRPPPPISSPSVRVSSFAVPNAPTAANEGANGAMRRITSVNALFTQKAAARGRTLRHGRRGDGDEIANATTRRLRRRCRLPRGCPVRVSPFSTGRARAGRRSSSPPSTTSSSCASKAPRGPGRTSRRRSPPRRRASHRRPPRSRHNRAPL